MFMGCACFLLFHCYVCSHCISIFNYQYSVYILWVTLDGSVGFMQSKHPLFLKYHCCLAWVGCDNKALQTMTIWSKHYKRYDRPTPSVMSLHVNHTKTSDSRANKMKKLWNGNTQYKWQQSFKSGRNVMILWELSRTHFTAAVFAL